MKYVYLILSENRLVILNRSMVDKNYHLLLTSEGKEDNMFCIGYIYGSHTNGKIPVNSLNEFQ